jgi:choline-sulfatase
VTQLRRKFSLLALTFCLAACRRSPKPNVLIITIDTLRADHLGCYGFTLGRTPVIDGIASQGVRCSDAISAAPITMPSHSSIFTGLYPPAHGVRDNGAYALGEGAVTLAERLHGSGYTTHAFVSAIVLNRRYNLNQGFETYDDDLWSEDDPKLFMIRERQAPKTTDRFLKWFDEWRRDGNRKPFFTWIHYFDPHQPYRPDRADAALAPSLYDAEIAGVDRQIGRIVDALKREGALDNTLLIVTADHGESLGEHGEKTHAIFVYDATVHVPLIVRYPSMLKPRVYDGPIRSVDITPTVLDILGLTGSGMDGRSMLAPLSGKEPPPKVAQYSESLLSEVGFGMAPLFSIREDGYKFIRAPKPELYDLRNDPHEMNNLVTTLPRIASRLDRDLTRIADESKRHAVKADTTAISRETEESLQALGYLAPHGERAAMQGIDPKDGLPLHNKLEDARHFAQERRWPEAEKLLLEVIAVTPRNVSAINVLGLMSVKQGDRDKAVHYYQQSLAVDPTQFRVFSILGALALTDGDLAAAEKNVQHALELNPHFVEAMATIGFIESIKGDNAKAESWYRKGIAADPTFPRVHRRLGDLYYERGDFARARTYYAKTAELAPTDMRAVLQEGTCARRLGRTAEADALFRRAEAMRPDSWIPSYNRACLQATTGHAPEALNTLLAITKRHTLSQALVERDPDLASVRALGNFATLQQQLTAVDDGDDDDGEEDAD